MPEIKQLDIFPLREPDSKRRYTILRVTARSGEIGHGESSAIAAADLEQARRVAVGREATEFEALRRALSAASSVVGALNTALLDIVGQSAKAPLFQVLGGPTRNRVRAMAALEGTGDTVTRVKQAGFRAAIVAAPAAAARNQGKAFVESVRRQMDRLRSSAGDDFDFVLDCGGALTPGDASSVAAALERFHLLWLDEPCAASNLRAIRKIADECVTPLGFGRGVRHAGEFQDLLREQSIDVLRPDLGWHGISAIRRMAALAETYYVAVSPRHSGGPVGTAAGLHLAASLPNFFAQQVPVATSDRDRRMREEIAGGIETARDGYFALPAGTGLGLRVNPDALARYKESAL